MQIIVAERIKNFKEMLALLTNARIDLFALKRENGKREKWRETGDHVVFLPITFAVNVMLNLSISSGKRTE